jgi:hypothetical protein
MIKTYLLSNLYKTEVDNNPSHLLVQMTNELFDLLRANLDWSNSFRQACLHKAVKDFQYIQFTLPDKFWPLFSWFTSDTLDSKAYVDHGFEDYTVLLAENHPLIEEGVKIAQENPSTLTFYPFYRIYLMGAIGFCAEIESDYVTVDVQTTSGFFLPTYNV